MKKIITYIVTICAACQLLSAPAETATERVKKAIDQLFPGWSLDSEVYEHKEAGIQSSHRGVNNVVFVHPKEQRTPAIVSRIVKLSDKNPCLFLRVASFSENHDFLLAVRINGMEVLPDRLVRTPDFAPWEDIVVSLSRWSGSQIKIELVLKCNNWSCEFPYLARLEIGEGEGDMRLIEGNVTIDGYTWSYRAQNGEAEIVSEKNGEFFRAVEPCPIGDLKIPSTIAGAKVVRIGQDAFKNCSAVTSVTIPEGVKSIGRASFLGCRAIRSLSLPKSLMTIEWDAFNDLNALPKIELPEGLKVIDRGAFAYCLALQELMIPANVNYIGQDAFVWCRSIPSVTIPQGVERLGYHTFEWCSSLVTVSIPASVKEIHSEAFSSDHALMSFNVDNENQFYKSEKGLLLTKDGTTLVHGVNGDVVIPPSVTKINDWAFHCCESLRSVAIPNGVKTIGRFAFAGCNALTSAKIPDGATDIGDHAFSWCRNLCSINIPDGVTSIHDFAYHCGRYTTVIVPKGVKSIGKQAFSWSGKLEFVSLPEGLESIDDSAFDHQPLTSVVIPSSVKRIGNRAFSGCSSLTSLTIPSTVSKIEKNAFDGCANLKLVNVVTDGKPETITFDEFKKRWMTDMPTLRNRGGLLARRNQCRVANQKKPEPAKDIAKQRKQLQAIQDELKRARSEKDNQEHVDSPVATKLKKCDFLINKEFKPNAKVYLCLFSASWCPPCRNEMPRIAKTYAEKLKNDPDIELIHFSCDLDNEKALAWANEHKVQFPVVKPNDGNPLNLQCSGIPHLFILKADGTLVEDGHPAKLFTEQKLSELKK